MMKCCQNVGKQDKNIRIVAGTILAALGLLMHNWLVALVGVVVLLTGVFGVCPGYMLMKKSTLSEEEKKALEDEKKA